MLISTLSSFGLAATLGMSLLTFVSGDDQGGADCLSYNPDGNREYIVTCSWVSANDTADLVYTADALVDNWFAAVQNNTAVQNATDSEYGCSIPQAEMDSFWSHIPPEKKFFYHDLTATTFYPNEKNDYPVAGNVWLTREGPNNGSAIRFCNYWPSYQSQLDWECSCSN